jgi:hypothetical protein
MFRPTGETLQQRMENTLLPQAITAFKRVSCLSLQ